MAPQCPLSGWLPHALSCSDEIGEARHVGVVVSVIALCKPPGPWAARSAAVCALQPHHQHHPQVKRPARWCACAAQAATRRFLVLRGPHGRRACASCILCRRGNDQGIQATHGSLHDRTSDTRLLLCSAAQRARAVRLAPTQDSQPTTGHRTCMARQERRMLAQGRPTQIAD